MIGTGFSAGMKSCDIPDSVQVGEDIGFLGDNTTSNYILDVILAHLLVVSEEIKRFLSLDLLHELLLFLGVSFKEVFFVVSDLDDERNVEDSLQVTDSFVSHAPQDEDDETYAVNMKGTR